MKFRFIKEKVNMRFVYYFYLSSVLSPFNETAYKSISLAELTDREI